MNLNIAKVSFFFYHTVHRKQNLNLKDFYNEKPYPTFSKTKWRYCNFVITLSILSINSLSNSKNATCPKNDSFVFAEILRDRCKTRQSLHIVFKIKPPRVLKSLQMWSGLRCLPDRKFKQMLNKNPFSKSWHWGTRLNQISLSTTNKQVHKCSYFSTLIFSNKSKSSIE